MMEQGASHAHRYCQHDDENEGGGGEGERPREDALDLTNHACPSRKRLAKVSLCCTLQPARPARRQGTVEPQLVSEGLDLFGRRLGIGRAVRDHLFSRISSERPEHEDEQREPEKGRDGQEDAPTHITLHRLRSTSWSGSPSA